MAWKIITTQEQLEQRTEIKIPFLFLFCIFYLFYYFFFDDGGVRVPATSRQKRPKIHQHDLKFKSETSSYQCSECKEFGIGGRYVCCESCNYYLHPDCMYYYKIATPKFLAGSRFKFYENSLKNVYCHACGMDILGIYYHCGTTKKYLHPCCLELPKTVTIDKKKFRLREKWPSKCHWCNRKSMKRDYKNKCWCYSSEKPDCHFHVYCMKKMLLKRVNRDSGSTALVKYVPRPKVLQVFTWAAKLLEIVLAILMGNPTPLLIVGINQICK